MKNKNSNVFFVLSIIAIIIIIIELFMMFKTNYYIAELQDLTSSPTPEPTTTQESVSQSDVLAENIPTTPTPTPTPDPIPEVYILPESMLPKPDQSSTIVIIGENISENQIVIDPHSSDEEKLAYEIFNLTNHERVSNGRAALSYNNDCQSAADLRAKESSAIFSHTRPDGSKFDTAITVDWQTAGENLIKVDVPIATPDVIVAEWMNSEYHRMNILSKDFKSLAVGIYIEDGVVYACQIFIG